MLSATLVTLGSVFIKVYQVISIFIGDALHILVSYMREVKANLRKVFDSHMEFPISKNFALILLIHHIFMLTIRQ